MKPIPISKFGKDHWSLLAYVECRCVDNQGKPDLQQMRCNSNTHRGLIQFLHWKWEAKNGTTLNDGKKLSKHDDHDCAEDLEKAGLIMVGGTGINPVYTMTVKGWEVVSQIRQFKAAGGTFATFKYEE